MKKKISYQSAGVNYTSLDAVKRFAQSEGLKTKTHLPPSFKEVSASRGESAYVLETSDSYLAFVQEGLGTKNLVADEMRKITSKTYYEAIAQDTVAMIINDLITVGARPISLMAYWAVGESIWFEDKKRSEDLVRGWKKACERAGVVWGGGETPALKNIVMPETIDLAGSAFGIIKPKNRLVTGGQLGHGDVIILLESSGIHANGLTLVRTISDQLSKSYATKLSNGNTFGEEILKPTSIYSTLVNEILDSHIPIHYMANITGHGWRKLMRAEQSFRYVIDNVPPISPLFQFIQQQAGLPDFEMYATFNMGAGFALYVHPKDAQKVISLAKKQNIKAWIGGSVEKGEKQVIIKPLGITYTSKDLNIR